MENKEYYDMLKKKIEERSEALSMYYSKLEVKKKLDFEIEQLRIKVEVLDRNITVLTPHSKTTDKKS